MISCYIYCYVIWYDIHVLVWYGMVWYGMVSYVMLCYVMLQCYVMYVV